MSGVPMNVVGAPPYAVGDLDVHDDKTALSQLVGDGDLDIKDKGDVGTFLENAAPDLASATVSKKTAWQSMKENKKAVAIAFAIQLGGMIIGLEIIVVATLVANQPFARIMGSGVPVGGPNGRYLMPAWLLSLWSGVYQLTQLVGMATCGWLQDRMGRKFTLWVLPVAIIIGALIEVNSPNRWVFLVGKIAMGFAAGLVTVIPTYVAEIAPRECRGILINFFGFFLNVGLVIGVGITYAGNEAYPGAYNSISWKMPIWCGVALPCVMGILDFFLLRESPHWLVMRNRLEDSKDSLRFIYPNKNDTELDAMIAEIVHNVDVQRTVNELNSSVTYAEIFKGVDRRRTLISIFPTVALAMSGYFLQSSYSTYFFELTGFTNSILGSVIVSLFGLAGCVATFFLIEILGRYRLVFWSTIFQTLCMLVIGLVNTIQHGNISKAGGWVLVISLAAYNVTAGGGAGGVYTAETACGRLRAKTISFALGTQALINAVWQIVLPYELDAIGPYTGYMFFGFGAICCVLFYLYIPELAGLSFKEIDDRFAMRVPARKFHSWKPENEASE